MKKFFFILIVLPFMACSQKTTTKSDVKLPKPAPDWISSTTTKLSKLEKLIEKLEAKGRQDSSVIKVLQDSFRLVPEIEFPDNWYLIPKNKERTKLKLIYSETRPSEEILNPIFAPDNTP